MAVSLKELAGAMSKLGVVLVAGEAGLDRTVRWVHMIEGLDAADFLDGHELVVTTGIGVQQGKESLHDLVVACYDNEASGVLVNTGPYIPSIPEDVVAFCDGHHMPLFAAPWDVHLSRVMHLVSLAITISDKEDLELAVAFKNAIFRPEEEDLYIPQIERSGFQAEWNYCVAMVEPRPQGDALPVEEASRSLKSAASELALLHGWRMVSFARKDGTVLVFADYSAEAVRSMMRTLLDAFRDKLPAGSDLFAGVGKVTRSARCISKSYGQASRIASLQSAHGRTWELCLYDAIGVDKLLLEVKDRETLEGFVRETVGPLLDYGAAHDSELVDVLRIYLEHNGSVQETAAKFFVHRNTVTYKLNKVESILGVSLSDFETRVELYLGLRAADMISR